MNTLSNKDINEIINSMGLKHQLNGISFKDDLPKNLKYGFYICNLQSKKTDGNGTHWTVFYYDGEQNLYYDSFGFHPPREIEQKINPYFYNHKNIQNEKTSSCGYYCIAFIKFLSKIKDKKKAFENFINLFDKDTTKNEMILQSLLYS